MLKWFAARSTFFNVCLFLFFWLLQLFSFFFDTMYLFSFFGFILFLIIWSKKGISHHFWYNNFFKNLLYFRNNLYYIVVHKDNEMKFYILEFNLLRMHIIKIKPYIQCWISLLYYNTWYKTPSRLFYPWFFFYWSSSLYSCP